MAHFKKLTCLILALILAFSLAGCGSEKSAVEKVIKTYTDGARTFDLQKMASCADGADAGGRTFCAEITRMGPTGATAQKKAGIMEAWTSGRRSNGCGADTAA